MADRLMSVEELSEFLGIPVNTVYAWSSRRTGPKGYRVGRYLRFKRADVDAWLREQQDPTPAA